MTCRLVVLATVFHSWHSRFLYECSHILALFEFTQSATKPCSPEYVEMFRAVEIHVALDCWMFSNGVHFAVHSLAALERCYYPNSYKCKNSYKLKAVYFITKAIVMVSLSKMFL